MPDKEYNGYIQSKLKEKICYNNIAFPMEMRLFQPQLD